MGELIQSFWYGPSFSPYERLCIRSFLDHGHRFRLYTYEPSLDVPRGCERNDAAEILPESRVFFYRTGPGKGSVAAFSNLFRYKLLLERGGWWMDTDVVCLTDHLPEDPYVFGIQTRTGMPVIDSLGSAVLKCPAGASLMERCYARCAALGDTVRWGEAGPQLVTREVVKAGLWRYACGPEQFYPYDWLDAVAILDPAHTDRLMQGTREGNTVHLWHEVLRRRGIDKWAPPPPGSFMARLFQLHGGGLSSGPPKKP